MSTLTSAEKACTLVDPVTRRHLILLLYDLLKDRKPNYGMMHKATKCLQEMLETKHGVTLGYGFKDPSIYDTWDYQLQLDLETYAALGLLVRNRNDLIAKNYYSHVLVPREPDASVVLRTTGKWNLERHFGSINKLKDEIFSACSAV